MDVALQILVGAVIGYGFGMLPTGMIVGRSLGVDLTQVGSGRTGATNALRTLGARWAAVVALCDVLKGFLAVLVAGWVMGGVPFWGPESWAQYTAASAAVVGHTYSPLIGFRGGRGILTGGGGVLLLYWPAFVLALLSGMVAIWLTRYVSVGSLVGAVVVAITLSVHIILTGLPLGYVVLALAMPGFVILAHRDNIQRLMNGTERKLSRGNRERAA
jgi:glycerol-3-phosphate acyltransferase PlsY